MTRARTHATPKRSVRTTTRKKSTGVKKSTGALAKAQRSKGGADSTVTPGAIATLKSHNRKLETLQGAYIGAGDDATKRREAMTRLRDAALTHERVLDEVFYPACIDAMDDLEALNRAVLMGEVIKFLLDDLSRRDDDFSHAKVQVLSDLTDQRIRAEEAADTGLFARAKAAGVDTPELAKRLQQSSKPAQESPMARYGDDDRDYDSRGDNRGHYLSDRGDHRPGGTLGRYSEGRGYYDRDRERDDRMNDQSGFRDRDDYSRRETRSYGDRDYSEPRDDRGRFTREDDRRFGTGGRNGGYDRYDSDRQYGARGSSAYDRNEHGGFQSGYDQGHPYARGYSGDYNRDYQSGPSVGRDDRGSRSQGGGRDAEFGPRGAHSDYDRHSVDEQRGHRISGADDHDYTRRDAGSRSQGQGGWESWR